MLKGRVTYLTITIALFLKIRTSAAVRINIHIWNFKHFKQVVVVCVPLPFWLLLPAWSVFLCLLSPDRSSIHRTYPVCLLFFLVWSIYLSIYPFQYVSLHNCPKTSYLFLKHWWTFVVILSCCQGYSATPQHSHVVYWKTHRHFFSSKRCSCIHLSVS